MKMFVEFVGPVLTSTITGQAVADAIVAHNAGAVVSDHGGYLRGRVPERCIVTRRAIEGHLGATFSFPSDLERIMPSFAGRMTISDEGVQWE